MPCEQILTAPVPRDSMCFLMYVVSDPSESANVLVPCSSFSGCHHFIAVFDVSYDSHNGSKEPPWTHDAILAVAGKIKSSNKPLAQAPSFYKVLEEEPMTHICAVVVARTHVQFDRYGRENPCGPINQKVVEYHTWAHSYASVRPNRCPRLGPLRSANALAWAHCSSQR